MSNSLTHSAGNIGASCTSSNNSANSMSMNSLRMITCSLNGWVCLTSLVSKSTKVLGRLLVMIPLTGSLSGSLGLCESTSKKSNTLDNHAYVTNGKIVPVSFKQLLLLFSSATQFAN